MKNRRILFMTLLAAACLSLASTCVIVEEGPVDEDIPYGEESAEMQTQDEQMQEVEEQIER